MDTFINYGDATPLEHGGFIVEPATGQVVFFDGLQDTDEDELLVHRTTLDEADASWIDWDKVGASCGWNQQYGSTFAALSQLNAAQRLQCAVGYYGAAAFDSSPDRAHARDIGDTLAPLTSNFQL